MRMKVEEGTATVQAGAFLAAALAGAASIMLLKTFGVRQMFVTIAPCLVMAAYASLIVRRYYRARADQIGDNLYYLGFIFTLVSLSVSLAQFSAGGTAEEIVANFGVALATTLVGVTLRVVFSQMRSDPFETEKEARLQLAEASRRLKVEMMNASAEFGMAARASRQSVADAIEEMREKLGATLDEAGGRLRDAVSQSAEGLAGASKGLESQLGGAAARLSEASDALRGALDASQSRWDDGLRVSMERNTEFNTVGRRLSAAVDRLAKRMEEGVGPIDGVEQRFAALSSAAEGLEARLAGAREQLDRGLETVVAMGRETVDAGRVAAEASAALQAQAAGLERAVAAIERAEIAAEAMEAQPVRISEALGDVEEQVRSVIDRATAAMERVEAANAAPPPAEPLNDEASLVQPYVPPVHTLHERPPA
ncbi:hypothetical protein [Sphingomonas sp. Leaf257]|jgi:hypothetical protein|uniref:hypothetical protein n=1 Tax=Sphingomonas sp. Leaf257 TaxID=1736309 RepID=UPI000A5AC045|nr:hypothetical protein [Sphingomonas sp. Leaf257]